MKNLLKAVLCITLVAPLSGCFFDSKSPAEFSKGMTSESNAAAVAEQATVSACQQWMLSKEKEERAQYNTLLPADKGYALMHRETMGMIKDVWGKGNECKPGTNMWDAYIVHVKEIEASHREYAGAVKQVATVGIYGYAATNITKAVVGAVGDKFSTTGENAAISKTTTSSNTTAVANDKSTASAQGASQGSKETPTGTSGKEVSASEWNECITTTGGARPSADEVNGCMIGYGYKTEVKDGQLYKDGVVYNGPSAQ